MDVDGIRALFLQCETTPGMRGVTAVLRIAREQLSARGQNRTPMFIVVGFPILGGVVFVISKVLHANERVNLPSTDDRGGPMNLLAISYGLFIVGGLFAYGAIQDRKRERERREQQDEICRLAAESLDRILAHPFEKRPLTREQVDTLREIQKKVPANPAVGELLAL